MTRAFIHCLSFLLFSFTTLAQRGTVMGIIKDKKTDRPLPQVSISLQPGNIHIFSDETGAYRISGLEDKVYFIHLTHIGYHPASQMFAVNNEALVRLDFSLESGNLNMAEVKISAKRNSNLNTLSAIDLRLRPNNNSQEILRRVPGLFIAQHAGGGKAEQIFLRGYDVDHGTDINLSVDGMPVNMVSHAHGQGYSDLHFLIPETINKVQFEKGPFYAAKGNLATAGFAEFSTFETLPANLLKLERGNFTTNRIVGMANILKEKRTDAYLAGEYFTSNGFFENPIGFRRINLTGRFNQKMGSRGNLSVLASHFSSRWNASGQIPERAVKEGIITRLGSLDPTEGGNTGRTSFSLKHNTTLASGAQLRNQVYVIDYRFNLYSNFTFFLNDSANGDQINQRESRRLAGYNGALVFNRAASRTEIGWMFRYDDVKDIALSRSRQRRFIEDLRRGDVRELNGGAYASRHWELGKKFNLDAGIRMDYFRFGYRNALELNTWQYRDKFIINPKLRAAYQLNAQTQFFAMLGSGFHSNDSRTILDAGADKVLPKVYSAETGIWIKPLPALLIKSSFWYSRSQQEFVYVGDEGIVEAAGRSQRLGVDFSTRYQMGKFLFADIDLNYARPRLQDLPKGENHIPLAPAFTSTGGLTLQNFHRFGAGLRYRYMADRPANENNSVIADGYFITDAVLNYTWKKMEFSLSAENLFNIKWKEAQFDTESRLRNENSSISEIHYTPGTPRFLKLGVAVGF